MNKNKCVPVVHARRKLPVVRAALLSLAWVSRVRANKVIK